MYTAECSARLVEEDDFEKGCCGKVQEYPVDLIFKNSSLDGLIQDLQEAFGPHSLVEPCRDGYLEFQRLEDVAGHEPTHSKLELWKASVVKLYNAIYTFEVSKVEEVDLESLIKSIKI